MENAINAGNAVKLAGILIKKPSYARFTIIGVLCVTKSFRWMI
jgi:hypothetical protein